MQIVVGPCGLERLVAPRSNAEVLYQNRRNVKAETIRADADALGSGVQGDAGTAQISLRSGASGWRTRDECAIRNDDVPDNQPPGHQPAAVSVDSCAGPLVGLSASLSGSVTAHKMANGSLDPPESLLAIPWIAAIGVSLILAAALFAIRDARLANPEKAGRLAVPILMLAGFFGVIVFGWGITS